MENRGSKVIYSTHDIKRILGEIWKECSKPLSESGPAFFFRNDNLPPKILLESRVAEILNSVKEKL